MPGSLTKGSSFTLAALAVDSAAVRRTATQDRVVPLHAALARQSARAATL